MRMSDFVVRDAIIPDLAAVNKEGVIREMAASLCAAGCFREADQEDVVRAILKRELLGSTGIGRGVAIPHTKHNGVERLIGTVAVSPKGVSFESLDGEPVQVFVLLISPQDRPGDHLRAVGKRLPLSTRRQFRQGAASGDHARSDLEPARKIRSLMNALAHTLPPLFPRDAMESSTLRNRFVLTNHQGLHMRPCGAIAAAAVRFRSNVTLSLPDRKVNAKSILDLMTLGAPKGTELAIEIEGPDAREALDAMVGVFDRVAQGDFDEKEEA